MPRLYVKVVGIPLRTEMGITAPRRAWRLLHHLLFACDKSFLRFSHTRRRHNASILFQMSLDRFLHPTAKVQKLLKYESYSVQYLQNKTIKILAKNKKTEDFQHLFDIFVYFCR